MSSLHIMNIRKEEILQEINRLLSVIGNSPEAKIYARKRSDTNKYFFSKAFKSGNKIKEEYISAEDPILKLLTYRMWAIEKLKDLYSELSYLNKSIKFLTEKKHSEEFVQKHPWVKSFIQNELDLDTEFVKNWKEKTYLQSQRYPEALKYKTVVPNLMVRSKSESIILSRLEKYEVPYRYEEVNYFDGIELAFDFTCLNKRTHSVFYWDHRGMLDDPKYQQLTLRRDSLLLKSGIIQGINLIVTTETKDFPLDVLWVDQLINYYLL